MSEISILTVDGVSFNLSDDKVRGSLSEVEMTPRASKTYAVGDYLIYQGRFYKVVQVIDQDSFFEIGTNIIPVTVGAEKCFVLQQNTENRCQQFMTDITRD